MEEYISEPTSAAELFKIAGKRCNVYSYEDLKNYDDIDEIFEEHDTSEEVMFEETYEKTVDISYSDESSNESSSDYDDESSERSSDYEEEKVIIKKGTRIDKLPFDDNAAIILYKSEPMFGHWTMVTKNNGDYNYLDSYGEPVDNPLKYVPKTLNKELGQDKKYLAKLLLKAMEGGSEVYYNNAKLQKLDPKVATCGRYCALYLKYSDMNVDDFAKMIKKLSKKHDLTNDELVTYLSMEN